MAHLDFERLYVPVELAEDPMTTNKLPHSLMPAMYSHRIHDIQTVARAHGYAMAVHGSMQRDLDLIAIPWTEKACSADRLVQFLCDELYCSLSGKGTLQPHGRVSYTLLMGGACFMDLSVMPRTEKRK